jgi:hypothetical protein
LRRPARAFPSLPAGASTVLEALYRERDDAPVADVEPGPALDVVRADQLAFSRMSRAGLPNSRAIRAKSMTW